MKEGAYGNKTIHKQKMYIKDTHLGFYLIAAIVGLAIGQFVDWIKERLPENKKVFSTDIIRKYKIEVLQPLFLFTKNKFYAKILSVKKEIICLIYSLIS